MSEIPDSKRRSCADNALHGYGTAYIFEKRASKIQNKIKVLSFLGIAVPASVGATLGGYKLSPEQIGVLLYVASSIAIFQLLLSIWSLSSGWDAKLSDYLDLKNKNYGISEKYSTLGNESEIEISSFNVEFGKLDVEKTLIKQLTDRHSISEKEKRKGMRYALRKFQRSCAGCTIVPTDMKNTDCGVCGHFSIFNK